MCSSSIGNSVVSTPNAHQYHLKNLYLVQNTATCPRDSQLRNIHLKLWRYD